MEKEKKRKGGAEKEHEKNRKKLHDIAAKCMNIQEVFAKVSSPVRSQTKSVNFAMHELDKDQSANFSIDTGLILGSQDSSSFKTIAPPSVLETTALPSVSITVAPTSVSKNYSTSICKYCCVGIRNLKPLLVCKT